MQTPSTNAATRTRGFTLVEVLITLAVFGVISTILFSILQAGSVLLAKNVGINISHSNARLGSERLLALVQSSVAAPILVDASLNPIAGNGPAAGITFLRLASPSTYTNPNAIAATATSFTLRRTSTMPAPQTGSVLVMVGTDSATFASPYIMGFQGNISSVTAINSTDSTVNFASTAGSLCNPATASGTVLPANTKLFLLNKLACVANGTELRLLNNASVPTTYDVVAQLVALTGQATLLPFRYTTADRRWVDIDLRVQSPTYSKRNLGTNNTFFDLKESIAYRSAIIVQNGQ